MLQKHDNFFLLSIEQAIFEKTRCGKLKKDRQCNDQKKRGKRTNNDLKNTSQKTKIGATRTRLKSEYYFSLHSIASLIMSQKHDKSFLLSIEQAIFEKTKGVIRCGKLKKDRQCNDQKKRGKRAKNDLENTSQKTKVRATQTRLKTGGAQVLYLLH